MTTKNPFEQARDGETPTQNAPAVDENLPERIEQNTPAVDEQLPERIEENAPAVTDNPNITTDDIEKYDSFGSWWTRNFMEFVEARAEEATTLFLKTPDPLFSRTEGPISAIQQMFDGLVLPLVILSVLCFAYRTALNAYRGDTTPIGDFVKYVFLVGFGTAAVMPLLDLFSRLCEALSYGIIEYTVGESRFAENMVTIFMIDSTGISELMAAVLFAGAILAQIPLMLLLIVKYVVVVILGGLMMVSIGMHGIGGAREVLKTHLQWIIAALLIDPAMATILGVGFSLMGGAPIVEGGFYMFLMGMGVILLTLAAPILMIGLVGQVFSTVGNTRGIHQVTYAGASSAVRFASTKISQRTGRAERQGAQSEGGPVAPIKSSSNVSTHTSKPAPVQTPAPRPATAPQTAAKSGAAAVPARASSTYTGTSAAGAATKAAAPAVSAAAPAAAGAAAVAVPVVGVAAAAGAAGAAKAAQATKGAVNNGVKG